MKGPVSRAGNLYILNGAGSKWIQDSIEDSIDHPVNIVNVGRDQLFTDLRNAISESVPDPTREKLLDALESLASVESKRTFSSRYAEFVQLAANHLTVIGPFVPALTQLLVAPTAGQP